MSLKCIFKRLFAVHFFSRNLGSPLFGKDALIWDEVWIPSNKINQSKANKPTVDKQDNQTLRCRLKISPSFQWGFRDVFFPSKKTLAGRWDWRIAKPFPGGNGHNGGLMESWAIHQKTVFSWKLDYIKGKKPKDGLKAGPYPPWNEQQFAPENGCSWNTILFPFGKRPSFRGVCCWVLGSLFAGEVVLFLRGPRKI